MKESIEIALQFLALPEEDNIILQVDNIQELWMAQKYVRELMGRPHKKNFHMKQWVYKLDSEYKVVRFSVINAVSEVGLRMSRLFYVGRGR